MKPVKFSLVLIAIICAHSVTNLASADLIQANGFTDPQAFINNSFNFRDTRTANQSGFSVGDRIAFGIDFLTPNPEQGNFGEQTTVTATQAGQTFPTFFQGGLFEGEYFNSIDRPSNGSLDGSWTLEITNPTSSNSPVLVTTNDIVGVGTNEFVSSMSLSGDRTTPTLNWNTPAVPGDSVRLFIQDVTRDASGNLLNPANPGAPLGDQYPRTIHRDRVEADITTYDIPPVLEDGTSLIPGRSYDVAIQIDKFNGEGFLVSRSRAFFGFTPIDAGTAQVFLPSVNPGGGYEFNVAVEQEVPIVIDPLVAIGYDYEIGLGDPLFSSVRILSDVGDGLNDLSLFDASQSDYVFQQSLAAGELFDFGIGGIDKFRITGIELAAMIDPADVTAFMTEVAFETTGQFTGTMTPIVVDVPVPEPSIMALFTLGLFGLGFARRRIRS